MKLGLAFSKHSHVNVITVVMHQLKRHHKLKFMDLCRLVEIEDHTKFNFHLRQLVKCGLVEKDEQKLYLLTHKGQEVLARMLA